MVEKYKSILRTVGKKQTDYYSHEAHHSTLHMDRKQLRRAAVPQPWGRLLKHGSCTHFCIQDKQGHFGWTLAQFHTN